ncbi:MAG: DNA replication/repair protein RecF, partial [Solirubrobacteraceae bacterium]
LERIDDAPDRPLVSIFVPDRLELVSGAPAIRRAHIDHLVAALWPSRAGERAAYSRALAQRNALIARMRGGSSSAATAIASWNRGLAATAIALMRARAEAVDLIAPGFERLSGNLGLSGDAAIEYRPASAAGTAADLERELEQHLTADLERGYTTHGPHRDELAFLRDGRQLRAYGSQGERRLSLLALLLAERGAIAQARRRAPLMLLDDVMSELDEDRRRRLVEELRSTGGQSVIATTELAHVPLAEPVAQIAVSAGGELSMSRAG